MPPPRSKDHGGPISMQRTRAGLLGSLLLVLAACTSPAASGEPGSTTANGGPTHRARPGRTPRTPSGTAYKPEAGKTGGQLLFGDWQEANQFNPYYVGQQTEANVASAVWASLVVFTNDNKFAPDLASDVPTTANGGVKVPGDNGDAMTVTWKLRDGLKWSDGKPLTCDDFKYAWEWVLDKNNTGVVTAGWEDIKKFECASDTDMIWHFTKVYEGYLTMVPSPLPRHYMKDIPVADVVKGKGFGVADVAKLPVSGPFKFESVTSGSELRLVRNENYTNPRTGKPANLDSVVFKWYGDPDAMIAGFR